MMESIPKIPVFMLAPFVLMLASIAVFPLFAESMWSKNRNKMFTALILAVPTALWLFMNGLRTELTHTMIYDYIPFIVLLGSLFVITGGIFVDTRYESKPIVNTILLAIAAILASIMGTTGAAMLLIRPLMNINKYRGYKVHTVLFFIAIAANCGGMLTPLGDPPLFMMYLRGVPFAWFFHFVPEWLFVNGALLVIYFITDSYYHKKEEPYLDQMEEKIKERVLVKGKVNFLFLAGVVLAVAFINPGTFEIIRQHPNLTYLREIAITIMAMLSAKFTNQHIRHANHFNWEPIEEVAYLFFGIFVTMIPCLLYLEQNAATIGVNMPYHFYYASGALSSFLDNTPTAVTFFALARGLVESTPTILLGKTVVAGIPEVFMRGICLGAVFFGSMTYIGNGPNFMVKSIAEHRGIKMPHFFGYMIKFSLIILLPLFILTQILFVR